MRSGLKEAQPVPNELVPINDAVQLPALPGRTGTALPKP
jgi:hypothetical protein